MKDLGIENKTCHWNQDMWNISSETNIWCWRIKQTLIIISVFIFFISFISYHLCFDDKDQMFLFMSVYVSVTVFFLLFFQTQMFQCICFFWQFRFCFQWYFLFSIWNQLKKPNWNIKKWNYTKTCTKIKKTYSENIICIFWWQKYKTKNNF